MSSRLLLRASSRRFSSAKASSTGPSPLCGTSSGMFRPTHALLMMFAGQTRVALNNTSNSASSSTSATQTNKKKKKSYAEDGFEMDDEEAPFDPNAPPLEPEPPTITVNGVTYTAARRVWQGDVDDETTKISSSNANDEPQQQLGADGLPVPTTASSSDIYGLSAPKKVPEGEIISLVDRMLNSMTANAGDAKYNSTPVHKRFEKKDMRFVGEHENVVLEVQRLSARYKQQGPFMGSHAKDVQVMEVDRRSRREIASVPQMDAPYVVNETSFRRLPKNFRLPQEEELRVLYPQRTDTELIYDEAFCADNDGHDIDAEAPPIRFWKVLPPNYDDTREYPTMVVLADGHGQREDFEDIMSNFFDRPAFKEGLLEQEWVLLAPEFAVKNSWAVAQEAVIARFCDWVCANFKVEHGRVHLFGKGYGGNAALRTCLEQKDVCISCTAILGRPNATFRQMSRAQDKIKHLNGVHTLMYVPGRMRTQEFAYKFKFMMDYAEVKPAMRAIHFAEVADHQIYYCINPYEFWNHMRYFRKFNNRMLTNDDMFGAASTAANQDAYEPAFSTTNWTIRDGDVEEEGVPDVNAPEEREKVQAEKEKDAGVGGIYEDINVESEPLPSDAASAALNNARQRR